MKNKLLSLFSFLILSMMVGAFSITTSVFATNEYGIIYSGGDDWGEYMESGVKKTNVQEDPSLISELSPLLTGNGDFKLTWSNSSVWNRGYFKRKDNACVEVGYIKADSSLAGDSVYYVMNQGGYSVKTIIKKITVESEAGEKPYAMMVRSDGGVIRFVNHDLYSDATCENLAEDVAPAGFDDGKGYFVELDVKIYNKNDFSKTISTDQLYLEVRDIDEGESMQIRNKVNGVSVLSKDNMFSKNIANLQPTPDNIERDGNLDLRNKYVTVAENGNYNYIYSEYTDAGESFNFDPKLGGNVYIHLDEDVQEEGMNMVLGFVKGSVSTSMYFYVKEYTVKYVSDDGGEITGITDENVLSGNNPSGSIQKPLENYEFVYWVADSDVILDDGTVIEKGKEMTIEQIKKVKVNKDIVFKAIHKTIKSEISVPDTGIMTKNEDNNSFVFGIAIPMGVLVATIISCAINRRRHIVSFKK